MEVTALCISVIGNLLLLIIIAALGYMISQSKNFMSEEIAGQMKVVQENQETLVKSLEEKHQQDIQIVKADMNMKILNRINDFVERITEDVKSGT